MRSKQKVRFWPPAIAFAVVVLGAFLWLGWQGAVIAFIAHVVGGIGYAYNSVKSGAIRV